MLADPQVGEQQQQCRLLHGRRTPLLLELGAVARLAARRERGDTQRSP